MGHQATWREDSTLRNAPGTVKPFQVSLVEPVAYRFQLNDIDIKFMKEDRRPAFVLDNVTGVDFQHVKAQKTEGVPAFVLKDVKDFSVHQSSPIADVKIDSIARKEM